MLLKELKFNSHPLCQLLLALSVLLAPAGAVSADGQLVTCETAGFTVEAETRPEAQAMCRLISAALPQLESCHLTVQQPISVIVSDDLPGFRAHCLGYYLCDHSEIHILNAQRMAQSIDPEGAFAHIEPELLFESILVHELAHALFQQNACADAICTENQEYVAQAMQMAWLPEDARAQVVMDYPLEPPIDPMLLNEFVYAMAPDRYAALVWQHFNQPENGCAFVQRLLHGDTTLRLQLFPD